MSRLANCPPFNWTVRFSGGLPGGRVKQQRGFDQSREEDSERKRAAFRETQRFVTTDGRFSRLIVDDDCSICWRRSAEEGFFIKGLTVEAFGEKVVMDDSSWNCGCNPESLYHYYFCPLRFSHRGGSIR